MITEKAKTSGYAARCGVSIGMAASRCVDIALFSSESRYSLRAFTTDAAPEILVRLVFDLREERKANS